MHIQGFADAVGNRNLNVVGDHNGPIDLTKYGKLSSHSCTIILLTNTPLKNHTTRYVYNNLYQHMHESL